MLTLCYRMTQIIRLIGANWIARNFIRYLKGWGNICGRHLIKFPQHFLKQTFNKVELFYSGKLKTKFLLLVLSVCFFSDSVHMIFKEDQILNRWRALHNLISWYELFWWDNVLYLGLVSLGLNSAGHSRALSFVQQM